MVGNVELQFVFGADAVFCQIGGFACWVAFCFFQYEYGLLGAAGNTPGSIIVLLHFLCG